MDGLAAYARRLDAVVPVQIGWSRGADAVVVRSDVRRVNDLRGKVLAASPFNESDFFLRYLAQEAGIESKALRSRDDRPDPARVNLLYYEDAFAAGLRSGSPRLAGFVAWEPKVMEVVEGSGGAARVLIRNSNLLVVADVLLVNGGLAREHPEMVRGLVEGLLEGNRRMRDEPGKQIAVVAKAFGWTEEDALLELRKVHLANLPENVAFFAGAADAGGSFAGIYWSAALCYGKELIPDPPDPSRFHDPAALKAAEASGLFRGQKASITPVGASGRVTLEGPSLLSKDVRFVFLEGTADPDPAFAAENDRSVRAVLRLLQVGQGSLVRLRGFVDNAEWERKGRPTRTFQEYAERLSLSRAAALADLLRKNGVANDRMEVLGSRWVQNVAGGAPLAQNRRVEVEWFPLE